MKGDADKHYCNIHEYFRVTRCCPVPRFQCQNLQKHLVNQMQSMIQLRILTGEENLAHIIPETLQNILPRILTPH